jgi:hypothetical protein
MVSPALKSAIPDDFNLMFRDGNFEPASTFRRVEHSNQQPFRWIELNDLLDL